MNELNCNACGKQFSTKYNLRKHVEALHLKLKPYTCQTCTKTFAYKHSYCQHMQVHLRVAASSDQSFPQAQTLKALSALLTKPYNPPPAPSKAQNKVDLTSVSR